MVQIAPSILSANFIKLGREIEFITRGGAHAIHVDIMDGHFVPNISFGTAVVKCIKRISQLPLDVHLMVSEPDRFISSFIKAGADRLSVHVEATDHLHRTLSKIRSAGVKVGVSLNPATPLGSLSEILDIVDFVLVMSVNPGFGGQKFIPSSIDKVSRLHRVIQFRKLKTIISVDGGVDINNAPGLVKAGAKILIAGNSIFGKSNPIKAVKELVAVSKITDAL